MPTASDELRARWDMDTACDHLRARGFTMTPTWTWRPPAGYTPDADDLSASDYLVFEWDLGGMELPQAFVDSLSSDDVCTDPEL